MQLPLWRLWVLGGGEAAVKITPRCKPESDLPAPEAEALEHSERVRPAVARAHRRARRVSELCRVHGRRALRSGTRLLQRRSGRSSAPRATSSRHLSWGPSSPGAWRGVARSTLQQLGGGVILEAGGGSGALAADLLLALRDEPPDRYLLLDVSGDLRERQRRTLAARVPELLDRVTWLESLPEEPLTGVLLANEVLDALPVERFRIRAGRVAAAGGRAGRWAPCLGCSARARPARRRGGRTAGSTGCAPAGGLHHGDRPAPGAVASLAARDRWAGASHCASTTAVLATRSITPGAADGTLVCHYRHRRHADPFFLPGLQDLTAWVDFSRPLLPRRPMRAWTWRPMPPRPMRYWRPVCSRKCRRAGDVGDPARLRVVQEIQTSAAARRDGRALQDAGPGPRVHAGFFTDRA